MTSRRARRKDKKHNDRLRERAWESFLQGDLEGAGGLYKEAVSRAPGNARYLFELGLVERARGRDELAERAWRRVLAATPHHDGALGELALLLGRTGRLEEALELADQASSRPGSQPELGEQAEAWRQTLEGKGTVGEAGLPPARPGAFGAGLGEEPPDERTGNEPEASIECPRTQHLDWPRLFERLTGKGVVKVPRILEPGAPSLEVEALVEELERHAAGMASAWQEVMGTEREPRLEKNRAGVGAQAPEDCVPRILLGGSSGEEVGSTDVRPGRPRRRKVTLNTGDVAFLCFPRRPVRVGGIWGWQPVVDL